MREKKNMSKTELNDIEIMQAGIMLKWHHFSKKLKNVKI